MHFRGAQISTANRRWAIGEVDDDAQTCFAFYFFVRRRTVHSHRWKVITEFPDSLAPCSSFRAVPRSVRRDFGVEGANSQGLLMKCY